MTVPETIGDLGLVPVVVIDRVDDAEPLGEALLAGGLPCAEITFRTDAAAAVIAAMADAFPELLVGAGTVLTVAQAEAAVAAGSRFIVAPGFDAAIVDWCLEHDVPVIPGAMTPTEVNLALGQGLDLVKFFPAEAAGGVNAVAAIGEAYPGIGFIPTGGIDSRNLAGYLRLPMVAACGGSWLVKRELIAAGDFGRIEQLTAAAVAVVRDVRGGK
jgi:2-dehydro-3-deoxyphosphogluconate aldolase/(4S)-4-hydroxy-2-oxoglutarate aldolase